MSPPPASRRPWPAALAGAVTGIGSLPYLDADEAVRAVAAHCASVPFWPQLPQRSDEEGVIGQGLGALAGLIEPRPAGFGYQVKPGRIDAVVQALYRDAGDLTEAHAAGLPACERALRAGAFPSARALKGQFEGPVTLASYLFHGERAFLAEPALFDAVAFHLAQIVNAQLARLAAFGLPVLLFVDEPALCLDEAVGRGIPQERRLSALSAIFDGVRLRGAWAGLHCCAAQPFSRMCAARPDILSFDAHEGLETFFAGRDNLRFVEDGGVVAYGLIPTSADLDVSHAEAIFKRWFVAASLAGDPRMFARQAMITATCGLGLLAPAYVAASFAAARQVGERLQRLAE